MLKSHPGLIPPDDAETPEPQAQGPETGVSATDEAAPAIFTGPFVPVRPRDRADQWESPARRAHRLRMKQLFARGTPAV